MISQYNCVALAPALEQLKRTVKEDKDKNRTLIFCDSGFIQNIEKAVCDAVGGTFDVKVNTLNGFIMKHGKRNRELLSDQQSLMTVLSLIQEAWDDLNINKMSGGKLHSTEASGPMHDAISRMICSGILPEDLEGLKLDPVRDELLYRKVQDIARIYRMYLDCLNGVRDGKMRADSGTCLKDMPACLGSDRVQAEKTRIVFFGYQTFNKLEQDCIVAAMDCAKHVTGIFIHGDEKYYKGDAADIFTALGKERKDWTGVQTPGKTLSCKAAETVRSRMFDPEMKKVTDKQYKSKITLKEAPDSAAEFEDIAQNINRLINEECMCYRDIAVLVPGLDDCEKDLSSVFERYGIPYFAARKYSLESHPLCEFIENFIICELHGFRPDDVIAVIASPYFSVKVEAPAYAEKDASATGETARKKFASEAVDSDENEVVVEETAETPEADDADLIAAEDWVMSGTDDATLESVSATVADGRTQKMVKKDAKSVFRTYFMRFGQYDNSIMLDDPDMDRMLCEYLHCDYSCVRAVREKFWKLDDIYKANGRRYDGIMAVLREVCAAYKTGEILRERIQKLRPEETRVYERAYQAVKDILRSIEDCSKDLDDSDYFQLVRSGFASRKIPLTAQGINDVFVADFNGTVSTCMGSGDDEVTWNGCKALFCVRLTEEVPQVQSDCAFLSDEDWTHICSGLATDEHFRNNILLNVTAGGANCIYREIAALNICSFTDRLYLSYPTEIDGDKHKRSEIFTYVKDIFDITDAEVMNIPASVVQDGFVATSMACTDTDVYEKKDGAAAKALGKTLTKPLFFRSHNDEAGSISPTTIEGYFDCPYKVFMSRGLNLQENRQGCVQALDTGNFIHAVLQNVTKKMDNAGNLKIFREMAKTEADTILEQPPYSAMDLCLADAHTKQAMLEDLDMIIGKLYRSHLHTLFKPQETELVIKLSIYSDDTGEEYCISGKIDRVDTYEHEILDVSSGESKPERMVRVLDYKTGEYDSGATAYYMGQKLQPELYLLAATKEVGKDIGRPAAAYYFPCKVTYVKPSDQEKFRLEGFMDNSGDVTSATVVNLLMDENGNPLEKSGDFLAGKNKAITNSDDFRDFLGYAKLVSAKAIDEMLDGNINPSPLESSCKYCKYGGCCFYSTDESGVRSMPFSGMDSTNITMITQARNMSIKDTQPDEESLPADKA
ncbi:MAG: PD-(D/E)XK nuclease family protein [Clostridia bacterium]|nr:PD-(D/E)XK nuclease family protein [Clostridia bacterium]